MLTMPEKESLLPVKKTKNKNTLLPVHRFLNRQCRYPLLGSCKKLAVMIWLSLLILQGIAQRSTHVHNITFFFHPKLAARSKKIE